MSVNNPLRGRSSDGSGGTHRDADAADSYRVMRDPQTFEFYYPARTD